MQSQLSSITALDFNKINSETEFLYTFIDTEFQVFVNRFEEKIKTLEEQSDNLLLHELRRRLAQVEHSVNKFQTSTNKNSKETAAIGYNKKTETLCEHCHQPITSKYVMGGYFNNSKFHLDCKPLYEKKGSVLEVMMLE